MNTPRYHPRKDKPHIFKVGRWLTRDNRETVALLRTLFAMDFCKSQNENERARVRDRFNTYR